MGIRNPLAKKFYADRRAYSTRVAKSTREKAEQKDQWNRKAKHKGTELDEDVQLGAQIEYDTGKLDDDGKPIKKQGMVKNTHAPMDMVGITVDGEYTLAPKDALTVIEESIARLIELSK